MEPYQKSTCGTLLDNVFEPESPFWEFRIRISVWQAWAMRDQPDLQTRSGRVGVLVYLFRDENSRDTFAYSTDVTGRNVARALRRAKWNFMASARIEDLDDNEEATRHLRQRGFYVFRRQA